MEALVGQQADFEINPVLYKKPVGGSKDGCDVAIFSHPHQDSGSTVMDVLQLLDVFAGDPNEECVTVVQHGGDKGMDRFFSIRERKCRAEFYNIYKVNEGDLVKVFDMGLKGQTRVYSDTKVGD